jgi:hypothetical protein
LALDESRRRHDEHIIASALTAGFKQKRNIEHSERLVPGASVGKKTLFCRGHHRVENALEPIQRRGIPEHALPKEPSINSAGFSSNVRKSRRDLFDSTPARLE